MRELIPHSFCDVCFRHDRKRANAIRTFYVVIDETNTNAKPLVVETCARHAHALESIGKLARDVGRPLDKRERRPSTADRDGPMKICRFCDNKYTGRVLTTHLLRSHHVKPVRQPKRCPDCKVKFDSVRGMAHHRQRTHGYDIHVDMMDRHEGKGS